ncbi:MAG: molybdopterin-dependent oxidoreductase, partial [Candidatus Nanopelagicales bacterium]|nr:molybdopterin-dependent oxidoreductase [Candidatus Nanopelagicales bacterium]
RIGKKFVRLRWQFWVILIVVVAVAGVFACKAIIGTTWWQSFATDNPCLLPGQGSFDYPAWLRALHWFNVLLMLILLKSGIQILADHPRLYPHIHSTPDREWLRFRGPVPKDRVWTALDDSTHLNSWMGLPGGRHTSGMARHWHFFAVAGWLLVGAAFIILLFATGQWRQIVPTTTEMVPSALTCGVTYGSLAIPAGEEAAAAYNSLQLLVYFSVVFIAAPLLILTGLAQAPAVSHRYKWFIRLFGNRQMARSIHFLLWLYVVIFLIIHIILVAVTGLARNMNHIVLGTSGHDWTGTIIGLVIIAVICLVLWWANWISWAKPRAVQRGFERIAQHFNRLVFGKMVPRVQWKEKDISPYLWPNGAPPKSKEFDQHLATDFRDYRLEVGGLVENPHEFSLDELRNLGKSEQITEHDCVQGWSGVAKWGGVQMSKILDVVKPKPEARYAVFYAFTDDGPKAKPTYYDVHDLWQMREPESIVAWEMNGEPLPLIHGTPLRLRNERQVGFKQVKWIKSIEFRDEYASLFDGQGGFRPDNEYQARTTDM